MTTVQNPGIPRVKVESASDGNVKQEAVDEDMASPYMDEGDDPLEAGDLDFGNAQQQLWLTQIPRSLWETWSTIGLDDEIEIGTVRVEGPEQNPQRISLKLNQLESFRDHHKEYNLNPIPSERLRSKHPGQALVFSEQDLPGYKARTFAWENADDDSNLGQGRSQLFEKHKKDQKRRENNGRSEPYGAKPIPKKTALAGTVVRELQAVPVQGQQYREIESKQERALLTRLQSPKPKPQLYNTTAEFLAERTSRDTVMNTQQQRQSQNKAAQEKKKRQQENRSTRMDETHLTQVLLNLFSEYRIWGYQSLKQRTRQPDEFLKTVLNEVAFMHTHGDWNNKYELRDHYKKDSDNLKPTTVAPEVGEDSEMDKSGLDIDDNDEGDDGEEFEDAL